MARTYNVNNAQEAKKTILKVIMAEVRKKIGDRPIKININGDFDDR